MGAAVETARIHAALDDLLQPQRFADGQVNGLQVEGTPDLEKIASSVSVSQEAIDAATKWGADALLTHHGLLWRDAGKRIHGVLKQRIKGFLDHDLNLLTYHLPLDAHPEVGNNACLAKVAGCVRPRSAFEMDGNPIGQIGRLDTPTAAWTWIDDFERGLRGDCKVDTGPFQVWDFGPDKIETVGFVSGAAPYQVQDAIDAGLDAFVTGESAEAVYHTCKEAGIHFIAGGHYLTERLGIQRLGAWVADRFGVEHRFFDIETRV